MVCRVGYRNIAKRFSVSTAPLTRHLHNCIAPRVRRLQEEADECHVLDVVGQLRRINEEASRILDANRTAEPDTALRAIAEIRRQIELQAKLLGDLDDRPVVNVLLSPEWLELRAVIVGALEPYSEARESVLRALEGAGNGSP